MSDPADTVNENAEREHASNVQRSRARAEAMPGPAFCLQCGGRNDRQDAGFGTCEDCYLEG